MAMQVRGVATAAVIIQLVTTSAGWCGDWPQFRGPNRDGKSSESGLLKQWPADGPRLIWAVEDLGSGFASVAVSGGRVYTTGVEGETGYLYAYDDDGTPLWKKPYGVEWIGGIPGSRTTPTVDHGQVYLMSGHGRVVCFDTASGQEKWAVDTIATFGARQLGFGISESLLIDGDHVICTPGGEAAAIVALNKHSGQTVWICDALDNTSAYCSPILIQRGDQRLIVTFTAKVLIGLDPATGDLLWQHPHDAAYNIHATAPVYEDGMFYITSGYGGERGQMIELSPDGKTVTPKWSDSKLDCQHGGTVLHKGYVYGTSDKNTSGGWVCLNLKTGEVVAEIEGVGKGSTAYADGMIYGYGEKGRVGLFNADPTDFRLISSFAITRGSEQHWAHPAIAHSRLYIRHGEVLMAYDIGAKE